MNAEPIEAVTVNGFLKYRPGDVAGPWVLVKYDGASHWHARCVTCETVALVLPREAKLGWPCPTCRVRGLKPVRIGAVRKAVCEYFNLRESELLSRERTFRISHPRQLAVTLCRDLTARSYPFIGRHFGIRDHTTVMHGVRQTRKRMETMPEWAEHYNALKAALTSQGVEP